MTMDMTMRPVAGAMGGGHGGHGGHMGPHEHGTAGFGDTIAAVLVRLYDGGEGRLHATLGVSIPTGSVSERVGGVYTHYMMQLGSGTWDVVPNLTYSGRNGVWGWGAQVSANIKLEEMNNSCFRFGDRYQATLWASRRLNDWLSGSLRLAYSGQGDISGHYNGPHNLRRTFSRSRTGSQRGGSARKPRRSPAGDRMGATTSSGRKRIPGSARRRAPYPLVEGALGRRMF
jgi:hypothetical protein